MKHLKIFEIFVGDPKTLPGDKLNDYFRLNIKIGDKVVLNDKYFEDIKKFSSENDIGEDDITILDDSIFEVIYVNLKDKNDIIDTIFIVDLFKHHNSNWVDIDQVEICPDWKWDAKKYNL